jgi:hypothetical protein
MQSLFDEEGKKGSHNRTQKNGNVPSTLRLFLTQRQRPEHFAIAGNTNSSTCCRILDSFEADTQPFLFDPVKVFLESFIRFIHASMVEFCLIELKILPSVTTCRGESPSDGWQ